MTRRMILPLVFGLVGTAILMALGFWQVQRLEWKSGIIAAIETRIGVDPVAVPEHPDPAEHQYLRVRETGWLMPDELHVYTSAPPRGVGYRIIAPFEIQDGRTILLDRGFVPIDEKDVARPPGPLEVEGALAWPRETDRFTAEPDLVANIWFARDAELMAEVLGTEPVMLVAADSDDPLAPMPMPVTVNIANNHLEYAVTWFGLAGVWVVMTLYWLWRIKRRVD